jgi:hypothetical protein
MILFVSLLCRRRNESAKSERGSPPLFGYTVGSPGTSVSGLPWNETISQVRSERNSFIAVNMIALWITVISFIHCFIYSYARAWSAQPWRYSLKCRNGSLLLIRTALLAQTLTKDEVAAIWLYTTEYVYMRLNKDIRAFDEALSTGDCGFATLKLLPALNEKWGPYIHLLVQALQKLPDERTTVYRGFSLPNGVIQDFLPSGAGRNRQTSQDQ